MFGNILKYIFSLDLIFWEGKKVNAAVGTQSIYSLYCRYMCNYTACMAGLPMIIVFASHNTKGYLIASALLLILE